MKYPQLIVYETDGALANLLKKLAIDQGWLLRETRSEKTLLEQLADPRVSIVFLKLERDLAAGLDLLAKISTEFPDCPCVVVTDVKIESKQREKFSTMVYDLGAKYLIFPPLTQPIAEDLANGFMLSAMRTAGLGS